jgi:1-acyl-sn-glycerol-3-phosphate acyltransferase
MNALLKISATMLLLIGYLLTSCLVSILPVTGKFRRALRIRDSSFFSKLAIALFGIRVQVNHRERLRTNNSGCLVVSNHLSYIDVLIISSLLPSVFITSVELKHTFLLGMLARLSGCLFVERRKPLRLKQEINDITRVLDQGFSVVLFPEGTTSNGDRVHPFKKSLFDAAVSARAGILPLRLRYTKVNGKALTPRNRDSVFYYGGVTFFRHFPRLLSLKSVEVNVLPLKAIEVRAHASRKELAAETHTLISAAYYYDQMKA